MSSGQKSVKRAGRPGRLTGMAAGGSVAKLATVSVKGQPRSLAAAARASPAVSASTTQARTTSQRPVLPESRTTGQAPSLNQARDGAIAQAELAVAFGELAVAI